MGSVTNIIDYHQVKMLLEKMYVEFDYVTYKVNFIRNHVERSRVLSYKQYDYKLTRELKKMVYMIISITKECFY